MKTCRLLLLGVAVWVAACGAVAQERELLREARSENGRFVLRIQPARLGQHASPSCVAALQERAPRQSRERKRWERPLVSDVAPALALVRNDGRYIVTLDEHRRGGARHALVVYGEHGQLLRHFILTDLLRGDDWRQVRVRKGNVTWLRGAEHVFDNEAQEFVITLEWGRVIRVDLKYLRLVPEPGDSLGANLNDVPAKIMTELFGGTGGDAASIEHIAEKSGLDPEMLEKLADLGYLVLPPAETEEDTEDDYDPDLGAQSRSDEGDLRQKATGAGTTGDLAQPGDTRYADDSPDVGGSAQDLADQSAAADSRATEALAEKPFETQLAEAQAAAGLDQNAVADAATGIRVPLPDPANPVDYLQWMNETTVTEGPNAGPLYQSAIAGLTDWAGDQGLLSDALAGDPAALAAPEVAAWIDTNRDAIANFRSATRNEFRGFALESADGSLISAVLPNLSPLRQLARATVLNGRRLEAEGRAAEAMDQYLDTLAAGSQTGHGPTLIENLVGISMQDGAAAAVLDLAARDTDAKLDYLDLSERLESAYQPTRPMAETIQFERAMLLDTMQRMHQVDPQTGEYRLDPERARQFMAIVGDGSSGSDTEAAKLEQLATLDFTQSAAEANAYYDALAGALSLPYGRGRRALQDLEMLATSESANPLVRTFVPALGRVHLLETRAEATRRASVLVTRLKAYRQQYGRYPESLAVFGDQQFTVDPFADRGFVYLPAGDDFVLYSLGGNGRDDGGAHDPEAETNDVLFWPRPE
ncbi:MAG: hypothetical protein KKB50_01895 [Planctomycetes bacterium]|nr:hypothetical protein [Planctomycetota bacterium]